MNDDWQTLPIELIQIEARKIALELHGVEFRLAALQRAVDLPPARLRLTSEGKYPDSFELAIYLDLRAARQSLCDLVIDSLRAAAGHVPQDFDLD